MEIRLKIDATGDFTERDLNEFVLFSLGVGACSQQNPFVDENGNAEINFAECQNNYYDKVF